MKIGMLWIRRWTIKSPVMIIKKTTKRDKHARSLRWMSMKMFLKCARTPANERLKCFWYPRDLNNKKFESMYKNNFVHIIFFSHPTTPPVLSRSIICSVWWSGAQYMLCHTIFSLSLSINWIYSMKTTTNPILLCVKRRIRWVWSMIPHRFGCCVWRMPLFSRKYLLITIFMIVADQQLYSRRAHHTHRETASTYREGNLELCVRLWSSDQLASVAVHGSCTIVSPFYD